MVVAPYNLSYTNREPYITGIEFANSPIASAVDITQLIPNGSQAAQDAALSQLIVQASTYADNYCLGALGTLCATSNTENGRYRGDRYGRIIVHPAYWPILEVTSFSNGPSPGNLISIPLSTSTVWIEPTQFIVQTGFGLSSSSAGPLSFGAPAGTSETYCQYTYVNGFPNCFLTSTASRSGTSLVVTSSVGVFPGTTLTVWDGALSETVTVANTYDGVSLTLPLTAGLVNPHGTGTNVSALPATVKEAVIHLTVAMIKERGEGGLVLAETGESISIAHGGVSDDLHRGEELLEPFVQSWGRQ